MGVCALPNKDLTSVRTAPANPAKTDGKKWAIFVPQLSHILIVQRTTRILSVSCSCITQSNSLGGQLAQGRLPRGVHPKWTPPRETLKFLIWRMEQERRQTWKRQRLYITRGGEKNCLWEHECQSRSVCFNAAEKRGRVCIHGYL